MSSRAGHGRIIVAIALVALLSLHFPGAINVEAAPGPPVTGDWVVTGDEAVNGTDLTLDGSIIIRTGATLTLGNLTLDWKEGASTRAYGVHAVTVETGGLLILDNSTGHLEQAPYGDFGTIFVNGEMVMADSSLVGGIGVFVENGTMTMSYSQLNGSLTNGLELNNATANLTGCNLNRNGFSGLIAWTSIVQMLGTNVFDNKGPGMYLDDGTYLHVDRGWIGSNEGGGILLSDAGIEVVNTSVSNNNHSGIMATELTSKVFVTGGLITSNADYGIISAMAQVQLDNVSWALQSGTPNGKGRFCEVGDVTIHAVDERTGKPWYGATVQLNGTGGPYGPELMTEDKVVFYGVTRSFEDNNGVEHEAGPFELSCWDPMYDFDIGERTGGHTYDIWSTYGVTCNLSLPDLRIRVQNSDLGTVYDGEKLSLQYEVFNDWTKPISNLTVLIDTQEDSSWYMTLDEVPPMKWVSVNISFDTTGKRGSHSILAQVNGNNTIPELTEDNNGDGWSFTVTRKPSEWKVAVAASIGAILAIFVGLVLFAWYWSGKMKARREQERMLRRKRREREEARAREEIPKERDGTAPGQNKSDNAPKKK